MKVKTDREHSNVYGDSYTKKKDAEYECPDDQAKVLIDQGLVSKATEAKGSGGNDKG